MALIYIDHRQMKMDLLFIDAFNWIIQRLEGEFFKSKEFVEQFTSKIWMGEIAQHHGHLKIIEFSSTTQVFYN